MRPIRRILVAIKDPTAKALPAVMKAAQLAHAFGAHLELFHAISTPVWIDTYSPEGTVAQITRRTRDESMEQLAKLAARLRAQGLSVGTSATWDFPTYEAIVRRAGRDDIDLIVAERHAKAHILPGLLQLTDWELLRTSPVPVLLVKTATAYKRPAILAAVDPEHSFGKPATLDREILQVAKSLSGALRGPLHAVNAYIPFPLQPPPRRTLSEAAVERLSARTRRATERTLRRLVKEFRIPKAQCHVVGRHPIDAIERTSKQVHSNIVVLGAISRSGLKRFFFGNTAEVLLDSLDCDMLIVKPANFTSRVEKRIRGARLATAPYAPVM
jgi:universal stress protein E